MAKLPLTFLLSASLTWAGPAQEIADFGNQTRDSKTSSTITPMKVDKNMILSRARHSHEKQKRPPQDKVKRVSFKSSIAMDDINLVPSDLSLSSTLPCSSLECFAIPPRFEKQDHYQPLGQYKPMIFQIRGVALFEGNDIFSYAIKRLTKSPFSHTALLFSDIGNDDDIDNVDNWYCFEATGTLSEVCRFKMPHVRMTAYKKVQKDYEGGISHRLLTRDALMQLPDPIEVTNFVREYDNRSYETNPLELVMSLRDLNKKKGVSTVFCSELVAEFFYQFSIFPSLQDMVNDTEFYDPNNSIPSNWVPHEFSSTYQYQKQPILLNVGYSLTDDTLVKKYKKPWYIKVLP